MDERSRHNRDCFVCGIKNPIGLNIKFKFINQKAIGIFYPNSNFQSYSDVLHGGIVSSLLDGAMNNILLFHDKPARTGKLSVRFKKEMDTNDPLYVIGKIVKIKKRFALTNGEIRNRKKELVALGNATFIIKNQTN
jgi:acyl-coenzyme A thioesterase PaaI-like protein